MCIISNIYNINNIISKIPSLGGIDIVYKMCGCQQSRVYAQSNNSPRCLPTFFNNCMYDDLPPFSGISAKPGFPVQS